MPRYITCDWPVWKQIFTFDPSFSGSRKVNARARDIQPIYANSDIAGAGVSQISASIIRYTECLNCL